MSQKKDEGRGWMWGITITLILFGGFFVGFAIWTFQSDVELVYDNYYAKDVVFEQQIRRVERTDALPVKPVIKYEHARQTLDVYFPSAMEHQAQVGTVLLFRPSDLHKDRQFDLNLVGDSLQTISVPNLLPGLWRIKLSWTSQDLEYYLEEMLVVGSSY